MTSPDLAGERSAAGLLRRLALFPDTTEIVDDSLAIGGVKLASIADEFGTPVYIYDRLTMDASVEQYRNALRNHYPGEARITYAGKAFLCRAIMEWIREQNLVADCTGEAEIELAASANVPRASILVHGVNKSRADIASARAYAGTIAVDNLTELRVLAQLVRDGVPDIWLRWLPGMAVTTHHRHTQTGQHGSKFGMTSEEWPEAVRLCRQAGLPLKGLHFHQGSNFRDPSPLVAAIEPALDLAQGMDLGTSWHFSPGGGWSVAYHEDDLPQPNIDEYVRVIASSVTGKCRAIGLPLPILHLEPGRSLLARAGVAVYRVGVLKRRAGRTWMLVDGGMADNPRHALYGSRYSCLPAKGLQREASEQVSIAGPYCESGDVLLEDLAMPPMEEGELIAVPVSGAYQLSMSSNYNGAKRPAVVFVQNGRTHLAVRRETVEDLRRRDLSIL